MGLHAHSTHAAHAAHAAHAPAEPSEVHAAEVRLGLVLILILPQVPIHLAWHPASRP